MADDEKVLAAIAGLGAKVDENAQRNEANFRLLQHEVTNHGRVLMAHTADIHELKQSLAGATVPTVEQLAAHPLPRQPMSTLETIEQPAVSQSIHNINTTTQKGLRENRVLTIATMILVPIAVAIINSCGHH